MVDITITPASVVPGSNATITHGTAGATITAGQAVYKEASSGKWKLADSDSATAEVKAMGGIALNGAADNQPLAVATGGDVTLGAVLTAGSAYYLSETPGGIQPAADLAGEDVVQIGLAKSTSVLTVRIQIPGVTLA
jgi:hypothetical protein